MFLPCFTMLTMLVKRILLTHNLFLPVSISLSFLPFVCFFLSPSFYIFFVTLCFSTFLTFFLELCLYSLASPCPTLFSTCKLIFILFLGQNIIALLSLLFLVINYFRASPFLFFLF